MKNTIHRLHKLSWILVAGALMLPMLSMAQTTHQVAVTNNVFTPKDITIQVGDIIEWNNTQGFHNVNGMKSTYANNPESFGNSTGRNWTYSFTFTKEGKYDYQCDPHVGLGMVGTVTVEAATGSSTLSLDFRGMSPHVGQMFTLYVKDITADVYVDTLSVAAITAADFVLESDQIEQGSSYNLDFYADHNGNSIYDAPPTDHAWRMELLDVKGDTTMTFTHNTDFTDIMAGSTGIFEYEENFILRAFPNPIIDQVTIEFEALPVESQIRLFNLAGQELISLIVPSYQTQMVMDLRDFGPGIYLLSLEGNKSQVRMKVIKQ